MQIFIPQKPPTIQSFTTGGAGTWTRPSGCTWIRVRMCGAGGGGSGGSAAGGSAGSVGNAGTDSTFGPMTAGGGGGSGAGNGTSAGGTGGTATLGSGPVGLAISGSNGGYSQRSISGFYLAGSSGGATPFFGGAGVGGTVGTAGSAAKTLSGAGGGGGGHQDATNGNVGGGGGSGAFIDAIIVNPAASYSLTVGLQGTGGLGSGGGGSGGSGAGGIIEVTEYY